MANQTSNFFWLWKAKRNHTILICNLFCKNTLIRNLGLITSCAEWIWNLLDESAQVWCVCARNITCSLRDLSLAKISFVYTMMYVIWFEASGIPCEPNDCALIVDGLSWIWKLSSSIMGTSIHHLSLPIWCIFTNIIHIILYYMTYDLKTSKYK